MCFTLKEKAIFYAKIESNSPLIKHVRQVAHIFDDSNEIGIILVLNNITILLKKSRIHIA